MFLVTCFRYLFYQIFSNLSIKAFGKLQKRKRFGKGWLIRGASGLKYKTLRASFKNWIFLKLLQNQTFISEIINEWRNCTLTSFQMVSKREIMTSSLLFLSDNSGEIFVATLFEGPKLQSKSLAKDHLIFSKTLAKVGLDSRRYAYWCKERVAAALWKFEAFVFDSPIT